MKTIGVFDSGIGGLMVTRALRGKTEKAELLYLGDLARMPYGVHDKETVLSYSRDNAAFLLSRGAEMILIACNTATAASLEALQQELSVPVYGVIDAAVHAAAAVTKGRIGVIATEATVRSGSYEQKLRALLPEAEVFSRPCQNLVTLIERGVGENEPEAEAQCREYLRVFEENPVDTLVLGCTHFPMYAGLIARLLPGVTLVDTGAALAEQLEELLSSAEGSGRTAYFATAPSEAFANVVKAVDAQGEVTVIPPLGERSAGAKPPVGLPY